jgi:hypothetical protein
MGLTGAVIGGLSGLGLRLFSARFQKQRYLFRKFFCLLFFDSDAFPSSQEPWHLVLHVAFGSYIGYNYFSWMSATYDKVNEHRATTGHTRPGSEQQRIM